MGKPKKLPEPIEVDIPGFGAASFQSFTDIEDWARAEYKAWAILEDTALNARVHPPFKNMPKEHLHALANIEIQVRRSESKASDLGPITHSLLRSLTEFEMGKRPHSQTRMGEFILRTFQKDPNLAAAMLYFLRNGVHPRQGRQISEKAGLLLGQFEEGAIPTEVEKKDPLESLEGDVDRQVRDELSRLRERAAELKEMGEKRHAEHRPILDQLTELRDDYDKQLSELRDDHKQLSEMRDGHHEKLATMQDAHQKRHADLVADHLAEMARLRVAYETEMKLKAPAEYWADKRKDHRTAAIWAFGTFAGLVALGIAGIATYAPALVQEMRGGGSESRLGLSDALVIIVPALGYFWVLRLVSRIFVSNLASMSDAAERSIMISTFLALLADKNDPVTTEERLLILQAIFRPGPGMSGDDAPPPNLLEILSRHGKADAKS